MVRPIVNDIFFLGQKSEPATKENLQIAQDLKDTLAANTGWIAQIIQHEIDHCEGIVI